MTAAVSGCNARRWRREQGRRLEEAGTDDEHARESREDRRLLRYSALSSCSVGVILSRRPFSNTHAPSISGQPSPTPLHPTRPPAPHITHITRLAAWRSVRAGLWHRSCHHVHNHNHCTSSCCNLSTTWLEVVQAMHACIHHALIRDSQINKSLIK